MKEDDPITLEEACKVVFRGMVSPRTLREQARVGNLAVEKIGGRLFTTLSDIGAMREKCRVNRKDRASGSENKPESKPGTSKMEAENASQLAALKTITQGLKNGSRNTYPKSTKPQPSKASPLKATPLG